MARSTKWPSIGLSTSFLAGSLFLSGVPYAQNVIVERDKAMIEILVRSYEARPDPAFQFLIAESYARLGDEQNAIAALKIVADSDRPYLPPSHSPLWRFAGHPKFEAIADLLRARLPRTSNGVEVLSIAGFSAEGIAYDPKTKGFFLGDVRGRRIVQVTSEGAVSTLVENLMAEPYGMAVDAERRRLWIATSPAPGSGGAKQRSQLLRIDLETGGIAEAFDPLMIALNDVAVAPNGDVYATDFAGNTIWKVPDKSMTPIILSKRGAVTFPNGIAIDPNGHKLFVAQGSRIISLDTTNGTATPIGKPDNLDTLGIDGLYFHEGHLLGIQNVTTPGRVLRMNLDDTRSSIISFEVLDSAHPAFDMPTTGAIAEDRFVVLANSQLFSAADAIKKPLVLVSYGLSGKPEETSK